MIKDIVTNLSLRNSRDVAMDFAVSTAAALDAHLAGLAFVYEPIIPAMVDMYGMPPEVIESQRVENENMAKAALGRFDDAARGAALSAEPRMRRRAGGDCAGQICRYCTPVRPVCPRSAGTRSADPRQAHDRGGSLRYRQAHARRPLHSKNGSQARSHHAGLGWQPQRSARCRRRSALHSARKVG